MVFYDEQARYDLQNIYEGLLEWKTPNGQPYMDYEEIVGYYNDIRNECDSIDKLSYHFKTRYKIHQKYGAYVHSYSRNRHTTWYIIYDKMDDEILIYKIMNNYRTTSERDI